MRQLESKYFFKADDFKDARYEEIAKVANNKLKEFDMRASRLSNWPITRERYRQVLGTKRRLSRLVQALEDRLTIFEEPNWDAILAAESKLKDK